MGWVDCEIMIVGSSPKLCGVDLEFRHAGIRSTA
jgi:hypothetical protein